MYSHHACSGLILFTGKTLGFGNLCGMPQLRIVPTASRIPQLAFIADSMTITIKMSVRIFARKWLAANITRVYGATGIHASDLIAAVRLDERYATSRAFAQEGLGHSFFNGMFGLQLSVLFILAGSTGVARFTATSARHESAAVVETLEQRNDIGSDFEDHPEIAPRAMFEASEFGGCNIVSLDNFLPKIIGPIIQAFL